MKVSKKSNYEVIEAGNYVARLYQIIYLGTLPTEWKGEQKMTEKIWLTFELCDEKKVFKEGEEAKPLAISREFTLSMGEKSNFRPFVEGFIGTRFVGDEVYEFDIDDLIGKECLLNVVHNVSGDNTYANIQNATPLPKGMKAPALFNDATIINVNSTPFEEIAKLPQFLQDKMATSEEWTARKALGAMPNPKDFRPEVVKDKMAQQGEVSAEEEYNQLGETNIDPTF